MPKIWEILKVVKHFESPKAVHKFLLLLLLQRCLVCYMRMPREAAAVSVHVLCSPYSHALVYSATLFKATHAGWMCA